VDTPVKYIHNEITWTCKGIWAKVWCDVGVNFQYNKIHNIDSDIITAVNFRNGDEIYTR